MKIDIHTHILPAELPRFAERYGYGGFITLDHHAPCRARMLRDDGKFFREIESNCWDPVKRIAECDAHGVHVTADGKELLVEADTVVICAGQNSRMIFSSSFHVIGGAKEASELDAKRAMLEGAELAARL